MNSAMLRVTVLIDTYNQERYIEQAIASVLEQDFPAADTEILVVDDGSTDRTPELVRNFEPRLRLIRKSNGGQASAFNAGIAEARGDIVAFLDGDDWWAKEKLSRVVEAFEMHLDIAAVGHGYFEVYGDAPPQEAFVPEKSCHLDLSSASAARIADFGRTLLGTSRLSVRRRALETIGPIPAALKFCADTPILTLSLALGGAIVLGEPLCYYRHHSENLFVDVPGDSGGNRRKYETSALLLDLLPRRLAALGVSPEAIGALFESDRVEFDRLRLVIEGGSRWTTFRTEQQAFRSAHKNASVGYKLFRVLAGGLALMLPPRRFYAAQRWYSRLNLKRIRRMFGDAEPSVSHTFQKRPVAKMRGSRESGGS